MKKQVIVGFCGMALLFGTGVASAGSTLMCPDMSKAKQIVECPDDAEVMRLFKITCDFERDPDAKNPEMCDSIAEYKRRKFKTLWESADGEFMGYVTCASTPDAIKKSAISGVAVSQKNGLYKIDCNYGPGVRLTKRTYDVCRVPGVQNSAVVMRAKCDGDAKNCPVECD